MRWKFFRAEGQTYDNSELGDFGAKRRDHMIPRDISVKLQVNGETSNIEITMVQTRTVHPILSTAVHR